MKFKDLNTPNGLKSFLGSYHKMLQERFSFPPLGMQKAVRAAAPLFDDCNSWDEMAAMPEVSQEEGKQLVVCLENTTSGKGPYSSVYTTREAAKESFGNRLYAATILGNGKEGRERLDTSHLAQCLAEELVRAGFNEDSEAVTGYLDMSAVKISRGCLNIQSLCNLANKVSAGEYSISVREAYV